MDLISLKSVEFHTNYLRNCMLLYFIPYFPYSTLAKCDCLCKNTFTQKIKFMFLAQLIHSYILNSCPHTMSPMANWFAFLGGEDLQPCKTMTDTLVPVEHTYWMLLAWNSTLDQNDVPSA